MRANAFVSKEEDEDDATIELSDSELKEPANNSDEPKIYIEDHEKDLNQRYVYFNWNFDAFMPSKHHQSRRLSRQNSAFQMASPKSRHHHHYANNEIHTTKYNFWWFVPKNLYEQFRRLANSYFLALVLIQVFPEFQMTSPIFTALPIFSIVLVTAIKDGLEDWRRLKSDAEINNELCLSLRDLGARVDNNDNDQSELLNAPLPDWSEKLASMPSFIRKFVYFLIVSYRRFLCWTFDLLQQFQRAYSKKSPPNHPEISSRHSDNNDDEVTSENRQKLVPGEIVSNQEASKSPSNLSHQRFEWGHKKWKDLHVGDLVVVGNNQQIPADIIVLASSEPDNLCYVETKNLDGETNLKIRAAVGGKTGCLPQDFLGYTGEVVANVDQRADNGSSTPQRNQRQPSSSAASSINASLSPSKHLDLLNGHIISMNNCLDPRKLENFHCLLEAEDPNSNLYSFNASLKIHKPKSSGFNGDSEKSDNQPPSPAILSHHPTQKNDLDSYPNENNKIYPVTSNELLLRGCALRNTEWTLGLVVYAGTDTKLFQNSGETPSKRSRIEVMMNPQVLINLVLLLVVCLCLAIAHAIYVNSLLTKQLIPPYLGDSYYSSTSNQQQASSLFSQASFVFVASLIIFQNFVPISLYVTIEFIKSAQAFFIYSDLDMYHEELDLTCVPRTWSIADDLGQIEYIFSDKTGTLTRNIMEFRKCSIGGEIYGGYHDQLPKQEDEFSTEPHFEQSMQQPGVNSTFSASHDSYTVPNIEISSGVSSGRSSNRSSPISQPLSPSEVIMERDLNAGYENPYLMNSRLEEAMVSSSATSTEDLPKEPNISRRTFVDPVFAKDLLNPTGAHGPEKSAVIKEFFTHLAVCHTVLSEFPDEDNEYKIRYQAQSPDEAALVTAARDLGFTFIDRTNDELEVNILGNLVKFQMLNIIEFTSARKRMSVIFRTPEGTILLYIKGADSIIFDLLSPDQDDMVQKTTDHLNSFANEGLRTLCLAYRVIDEQEYHQWAAEYLEAATRIHDREDAMEDCAKKIEKNLSLLGATAIEDRLQDGVPECISRLGRAGIKIWVLTGDKMETAINIGFSCNLLTSDMGLVVIKDEDAANTGRQIREILKTFFGVSSDGVEGEGGNASSGAHLRISNSRSALLPASPDAYSDNSLDKSTGDDYKLVNLQKSPNNLEDQLSKSPQQTDNLNRQPIGLIIDGHSLKHALSDDNKESFVDLATRCKSVICCRVSPIQKAQVVASVKHARNAMTLSIGDGANDVSMIQEANVGVGIQGQEGMQAAMSSDYAIAQFRFLTKLLLVHGRWSYLRTAEMTLLMFYKNIVWTMVLFWYQIYCGWSAQILYNYFLVLFYNLLYTGLTPIVLGSSDQDISAKHSIEVPQVYVHGINQELYTGKRFMLYILDGLYQSFIVFYGAYLTAGETPIGINDSSSSDAMVFGMIASTAGIGIANMYMGLNIFHWTWIIHASIWGSILLFWLIMIIYSALPQSTLAGALYLLITPAYWFSVIVIIIVALLPRYLTKFVQQLMRPNDIDLLRELAKFGHESDWAALESDISAFSGPLKRQVSPRNWGIAGQGSPNQLGPIAVAQRLNTHLDKYIAEPIKRSIQDLPGQLKKASNLLFIRTKISKPNRGFAFSQEPGLAQHLPQISSPSMARRRPIRQRSARSVDLRRYSSSEDPTSPIPPFSRVGRHRATRSMPHFDLSAIPTSEVTIESGDLRQAFESSKSRQRKQDDRSNESKE